MCAPAAGASPTSARREWPPLLGGSVLSYSDDVTHASSPPSLDADVEEVIASCRAAHRRLLRTIEPLTDDAIRLPSQLPGWSVGHVLTHLARNADSHVRMLEAARRGEEVEQYEGGYDQRAADIEVGANRSADALREDVHASAWALEEAWGRMTPQAWKGHGLARGRPWPCRELPFHRWREVEIHHVDLGLGYGPEDWSESYVRRELPRALASVPTRLADPTARSRLLAWLVGRASEPGRLDLLGWQSEPDYYFTTGE